MSLQHFMIILTPKIGLKNTGLLVSCTFHSTFRVVLLQSVKLISMKKGLQPVKRNV